MGNITPFLKWAGGKRWLVKTCPSLFKCTFNRYLEPFLGSAAIFFHIKPNISILSDTCRDLSLTYLCIKNNWKKVYNFLLLHQINHSKDHYYFMRRTIPSSSYERAARFIYLNRTCWNGLYRVNRSGEFNVPIGTKSSVIFENDNFEAISSQLQKTKIYSVDFEKIINSAQNNDLIFSDPPYTVKHINNGFVKYNEKLFSWDDQLRLSKALFGAAERGAKIILTNASHPSILALYEHSFDIQVIDRPSVISGKSSGRGIFREAIITYGLKHT